MSYVHSHLVRFSLIALAACAAHPTAGSDDDTHVGEDALITFPAAAYSKAPLVSYGSTTTLPFSTADGFVAIKFNGKKGDVVRIGATTATGAAAISYLVFDKKTLAAPSLPNDPSGTLRYTVVADGEYFVMMRDKNRSSASIQAKLDLLSPRPSGDSKVVLSNMPFVAATPAGDAPANTRVLQIHQDISLRPCFSSGCDGPYPKPRLHLSATIIVSPGPNGPTVYQDVSVSGETLVGKERHTPGTKITLHKSLYSDGGQAVPSLSLPVDVNERHWDPTWKEQGSTTVTLNTSIGADGTPQSALHMAPIKMPFAEKGAPWPWIQYDGYDGVQRWTMPTIVASRETSKQPDDNLQLTLPSNLPQTPMDDEAVISRFPAGRGVITMYSSLLALPAGQSLVGADPGTRGYSRQCGPRTGCEKDWHLFAFLDSTTSFTTALDRILPLTMPVTEIQLRLTGPDTYDVDIYGSRVGWNGMFTGKKPASAHIEGGVGHLSSMARTRVTVTATGLLLSREAPPSAKITGTESVFPDKANDYLRAPDGDSYSERGYYKELVRFWGGGGYAFIPFNKEW